MIKEITFSSDDSGQLVVAMGSILVSNLDQLKDFLGRKLSSIDKVQETCLPQRGDLSPIGESDTSLTLRFE